MPLPDQGLQVLDLIDTHPDLQSKLLVLIGHSMGGLVIKSLIVNAETRGDKRFTDLVDRIRGVVFIATPHAGSHLANLASAARWVFRVNEQVGDMRAHDPHLRGLSQQFRHIAERQGFSIRTFAESRGVPTGPVLAGFHIGRNIMVVDPTSADPGVLGSNAVPLAADHFSICKPIDRLQQIHMSLCSFLSQLPGQIEAVDEVEIAVQRWLSLIDEENYETAWEVSSKTTRKVYAKDTLIKLFEAQRKPLGIPLIRQLHSMQHFASLPNGMKGDFRFFSYQTQFSVGVSMIEGLVLTFEDGFWKVRDHNLSHPTK